MLREAVASTPEPVAHCKSEVVADIPPSKQRRKTMEKKAFIGVIVTNYVDATNINNNNNNNGNTKNNDTTYKLN